MSLKPPRVLSPRVILIREQEGVGTPIVSRKSPSPTLENLYGSAVREFGIEKVFLKIPR